MDGTRLVGLPVCIMLHWVVQSFGENLQSPNTIIPCNAEPQTWGSVRPFSYSPRSWTNTMPMYVFFRLAVTTASKPGTAEHDGNW